jgi:hypothetical protein
MKEMHYRCAILPSVEFYMTMDLLSNIGADEGD